MRASLSYLSALLPINLISTCQKTILYMAAAEQGIHDEGMKQDAN